MYNDEINKCFVTKYEMNAKKMYLVAFAILHDSHLAEDAVQEALAKAYMKFYSLKNKDYFSTWIVRIVINECKLILRKHKEVISLDYEKTNFHVHFDEQQWHFFELIDTLNNNEKTVVILKYFYQMPLKDISFTLKIPLSTAKSRLFRALEKLKNEWNKK